RNRVEAWRPRPQECQDRTSLQLGADHHLARRVNTVNLKNRLSDVETDRRDAVHAALLRIVVTPAATTQWYLRAGGGSVHSISSGHALRRPSSSWNCGALIGSRWYARPW